MDSGIYIIRNKVNNKVYIGKTKNFTKRWKQYLYDFRNQNTDHMNPYLLASMNKHGFNTFEFSVLEYCSIEESSERELYWMLQFDSTNRDFGYNLRMDTSSGMITHELTREKISKRLTREWSEGIRSQHGNKLKESWERGDRDRLEQSDRMSKSLTKYKYILTDKSTGAVSVVLYNELKEIKLHGVISKFHKYKVNIVEFKGFKIERVSIND